MHVCQSDEEFKAVLTRLKWMTCPHCKRAGYLIRHGYLRGFDDRHPRKKTVRAQRVYCSNRSRADGCGRTFNIWWADKVGRLFLTAQSLWAFLKKAVDTGNKRQAFRDLDCDLSDSAPYRIWRRFLKARSAIRTALIGLAKPPPCASDQPGAQTLAHLQAAMPDHPSPIAAFQAKLHAFFL